RPRNPANSTRRKRAMPLESLISVPPKKTSGTPSTKHSSRGQLTGPRPLIWIPSQSPGRRAAGGLIAREDDRQVERAGGVDLGVPQKDQSGHSGSGKLPSLDHY